MSDITTKEALAIVVKIRTWLDSEVRQSSHAARLLVESAPLAAFLEALQTPRKSPTSPNEWARRYKFRGHSNSVVFLEEEKWLDFIRQLVRAVQEDYEAAASPAPQTPTHPETPSDKDLRTDK